MRIHFIPALLILWGLLGGCENLNLSGGAFFADPRTNDSVHHTGDWGYEGDESPDHWAELDPNYCKCSEGHAQSPIDIETYKTKEHAGKVLQVLYHPSPVDVINNGHTVQASLEAADTLIAEGNIYLLRQIHFHEPSEHRIDGVIYPMEMHLVHEDTHGRLAVIGVMIKEGPENDDLNTIWEHLPIHVSEHIHPHQPCDISHLLPEDMAVFTYSGSLTTPPCSEGVSWYVMKTPVTMSKRQIKKFTMLYHGNNRPVQEHEEGPVAVFTH